MTAATAVRYVTRILGLSPPYRYMRVPVTPKDAMCDATIRHATSPLDALVTYCDTHNWRVGGRDATRGVPPSLTATIYADGHDSDETAALRVCVQPVAVVAHPLYMATKYVGAYRIEIERPFVIVPSGDLVDW